ncbi:hypothetical protein Bbelb_084100 [Branchiostoma belcheri]|nr:hypothetical protein Bbelb_084100 [Branchiostoma belcheri]
MGSHKTVPGNAITALRLGPPEPLPHPGDRRASHAITTGRATARLISMGTASEGRSIGISVGVKHVEIAHPKIECPHARTFRPAPGGQPGRGASFPSQPGATGTGENTIELFHAVAQTGVPNYLGARLPVQSSLNVATWRSLLVNYPFPSLPDLLQFGWPINLQPDSYAFPDNVPITNHRSALAYAADVDSFLTKELSYGALCGPFRANPFPFPVFPAPLQTVEKRDCDKRRVVVDLSYPAGRSVNDAIPKDTYLVTFIEREKGFSVTNYIDDFGGAETPTRAQMAFASLQGTLSDLGLEEAPEKAIPPVTCLTWLGIEFDTVAMERRVPSFRLDEVSALVSQWLSRKRATKRELQSLIGKLVFVSACVPPGRLFVSRMLETLRTLRRHHHRFRVSRDFRRDLNWWHRFLHVFNGVSIIAPPLLTAPDEVVATDACSTGCGAFSNGQFFHAVFPDSVLRKYGHKIHVLEMLTIVVAARKWCCQWTGLTILVYCDNLACVHVLNSGRSRDPDLLHCSRELWFLAAVHGFELRASHIAGTENRIPDHLSRWHLSASHREQFQLLTRGVTTVELVISSEDFALECPF